MNVIGFLLTTIGLGVSVWVSLSIIEVVDPSLKFPYWVGLVTIIFGSVITAIAKER